MPLDEHSVAEERKARMGRTSAWSQSLPCTTDRWRSHRWRELYEKHVAGPAQGLQEHQKASEKGTRETGCGCTLQNEICRKDSLSSSSKFAQRNLLRKCPNLVGVTDYLAGPEDPSKFLTNFFLELSAKAEEFTNKLLWRGQGQG